MEHAIYPASSADIARKRRELAPKQLEAFAKRGRETAWPELKKVLGDKVFNEISATFVLK